MKKTISLSVGKGSIGHNNREFLTDNIDKDRIKDNIIFVRQDLKEAYNELFAEAIKNYNVGKKPSRQKSDYMKEIENSGNGEKIFQEIVVQIGDKDNTKLGSQDWDISKEILERYAKQFQSRNKNVHVFNSVLHLDESTPHLHISFIPVAENYKTGLSKRNSFSKAMNDRFGTKEGVGSWFKYEREVLSELALSRGIEIEVLGEDRQHLALKDYKETKDKIQELEQKKIKVEENVNERTTDLKNQYNQKKSEMSSELDSIKTQIERHRDELEDFKIEANKIKNERTKELNERLNRQTASYNQAVQQMKDNFGDLKERAILHHEKSNLIQENNNLKNELVEKDLIIENQNQTISYQKVELNKKDKIISKLQRTVEFAKEFIQEKAGWLGCKFNEFFKNKAKFEEIEVITIHEKPKTEETIETDIKEVKNILNDLEIEELKLMLGGNNDLKPVSELNELSESPETPLNAQKSILDDYTPVSDDWIPVNNSIDSFVEIKSNNYTSETKQEKRIKKTRKKSRGLGL